MPWLVVRSRMFAMRMTSWRGIRFGFRKDYLGAYGALLGWMVLAVVTFGFMLPYAACKRYEFIVNRTRFGPRPLIVIRGRAVLQDRVRRRGMAFVLMFVAGLLATWLASALGA